MQISTNQAQDFTLKSKTNGIVYSLLKTKGEIVSPQTPIAIIGNFKDFGIDIEPGDLIFPLEGDVFFHENDMDLLNEYISKLNNLIYNTLKNGI